MTRYLTLAIMLTGCSLPVENAVHELGNDLHPQCGWIEDSQSPVAPFGQCQVLVVQGSSVGVLLACGAEVVAYDRSGQRSPGFETLLIDGVPFGALEPWQSMVRSLDVLRHSSPGSATDAFRDAARRAAGQP